MLVWGVCNTASYLRLSRIEILGPHGAASTGHGGNYRQLPSCIQLSRSLVTSHRPLPQLRVSPQYFLQDSSPRRFDNVYCLPCKVMMLNYMAVFYTIIFHQSFDSPGALIFWHVRNRHFLLYIDICRSVPNTKRELSSRRVTQ